MEKNKPNKKKLIILFLIVAAVVLAFAIKGFKRQPATDATGLTEAEKLRILNEIRMMDDAPNIPLSDTEKFELLNEIREADDGQPSGSTNLSDAEKERLLNEIREQ